jgi:hypothetical protein
MFDRLLQQNPWQVWRLFYPARPPLMFLNLECMCLCLHVCHELDKENYRRLKLIIFNNISNVLKRIAIALGHRNQFYNFIDQYKADDCRHIHISTKFYIKLFKYYMAYRLHHGRFSMTQLECWLRFTCNDTEFDSTTSSYFDNVN